MYRIRRPDGSGTLDMDLAAPGGIGSENTARQLTHTLRITLADPVARAILRTRSETAVLTIDPVSREPIIWGQVYPNQYRLRVPSIPELLRILEVNPQINLHIRVISDQQLVMMGQVARPEPMQIVLRNEPMNFSASRPSPVVGKVPASPLPPLLQAISRVDAHQVSQTLTVNYLNVDQYLGTSVSSGESLGYAKLPSELAKSVARSIQTIGGEKPMLIPDISAAVPRAIAPDALPTSVPIRQPIAGELGLKPGEVVQALVASSGDKMALQLGQYRLPLPSHMKLPEGQVLLRVIQTKEGLAFVPQLSQQPQASQALSTSGLSAALAAILTRNMARPQIQSLFAPQGLESFLIAVGLTDEAKRLNTNRLPSNQLTGDLIKNAIQFGALGNEKALLEGVALRGGMLKPWLRQILRLLPQQSELTSRIAGLVTEIESLQIEALPQSHIRESGLVALLLLRDQPPVELLFERKNVTDGDKIKRLWILNLHTSLDSLGEVWMKSSFSGTDVELTFWAKEEQTAALAKKSKMDLKEALMEHDLRVKSMQIFASPRPGFEKLSSEGMPHLDAKA